MRGVGPNNPTLPILLAALADVAERGEPCPDNFEISRRIGRSSGTISDYMAALELADLIQVRRKSNRRAVMIVATGKTTAQWDTLFDAPPRQCAVPEEFVPPPLSLRTPCPCCNTRLDADPSLCCARGRALRKVAA